MTSLDHDVSIIGRSQSFLPATTDVCCHFTLPQLGDIASFIVDKEIEILDGLQTLVKECSPTLLAAHAAITQIDWFVS